LDQSPAKETIIVDLASGARHALVYDLHVRDELLHRLVEQLHVRRRRCVAQDQPTFHCAAGLGKLHLRGARMADSHHWAVVEPDHERARIRDHMHAIDSDSRREQYDDAECCKELVSDGHDGSRSWSALLVRNFQ
jgi:hypothetical protein